jgi:serine/threonine-protein kinase
MRLLSEGQIIRGTYEVERFLGEGAFAEVYRVKHRFLGRQAMKLFKMVGLTLEEIELLLGEAIILSQIGHPNIIRVFDANTVETSKGTCGFFTMEHVAGGDLVQFWRSHGAQFVPVETVVDVVRQVCEGLAVAHGWNPPIIHRDIKPQNILVGYDTGGRRARLSDFGLAKQVNPLTRLATGLGTLPFKPPEVFRDPKSDSCAGDVWALGTTLYLLLTDRLPFGEPGDIDSFDASRFQQVLIPPSRLNAEVDADLDQIVFRALAIDTAQRYANAKAFLDDLTKWKPHARSGKAKALGSSDSMKSALGRRTPLDGEKAQRMAQEALKLARERGRLLEAADLMEQALNLAPDLREKYEFRLQLWRKGIVQ